MFKLSKTDREKIKAAVKRTEEPAAALAAAVEVYNEVLGALRIPMHRGHLLRFDRGQATDLMAATIPI